MTGDILARNHRKNLTRHEVTMEPVPIDGLSRNT